MKKTVVLQYVGPETKKWEVVTQLGNGKVSRLVFNKANEYSVEIPLELTFLDPFRKTNVVQIENYPLFLLNSYGPKSKTPVLRFVKEVEHPDFVADPLEKFKSKESQEEPKEKSEDEAEKRPGRKKKEQTHEER